MKRNDFISFLVVATNIAFFLAPVYLAVIRPIGLETICYFLVYGMLTSTMINLLHESSHFHIFKRQKISRIFGHFILGPLLFTDFDAYKSRHWKHHTDFGMETDSKDAYLKDIRGIQLVIFFIRCFLMLEAVRVFSKQIDTSESRQHQFPLWMVRTAIFQSVFIGSLLLFGFLFEISAKILFLKVALAYFGIYMYGLSSFAVFVSGIRTISEHAVVDPQQDYQVGRAALRNLECNFLTDILFGSYGFKFHKFHHQNPGIPYYRLSQVAEKHPSSNEEISKKGYFSLLAKLVTKANP